MTAIETISPQSVALIIVLICVAALIKLAYHERNLWLPLVRSLRHRTLRTIAPDQAGVITDDTR